MWRRGAVPVAAGVALAVMATGTATAGAPGAMAEPPGAGPGGSETVPGAVAPAGSVTVEELPTLGGTYSSAYAINDRGEVAGEAFTILGFPHAVLWRDGWPLDLTPFLVGWLHGPQAQAQRVGENGHVLGDRTVWTGQALEEDTWMWRDGWFVNLTPEVGSRSTPIDIDDRGRALFNYEDGPTGDDPRRGPPSGRTARSRARHPSPAASFAGWR